MHSNASPRFNYGPHWFRRFAPAVLLFLTVMAVVLVVGGVGKAVCQYHYLGGSVEEATQPPQPHARDVLREVTDAVYNTGRILVFDVEPEKELRDNWMVQVGAIAVALSVGVVGLGLWFRLYDSLRLSFAYDHVVVCGLGSQVGLPLARQCVKAGRRVVAIDDGSGNAAQRLEIEELRARGAIVLEGAPSSRTLINEAKVNRARLVVAVADADVVNLETALAVADVGVSAARCHVHISSPVQAESFAAAMAREGAGDQVTVFSRPRESARHLLAQVSIYARPEPGRSLQVVLIGFGDQGQAVAREFAAHAHFEGGRRLEFLICDPEIAARRDAFLARFPRFCPVPESISLKSWSGEQNRWEAFSPKIRPESFAQGEGGGTGPGIEFVAAAEFLPLSHGPAAEVFLSEIRSRLRADERTVMVLCLDDERQNADAALRLGQCLRASDPTDLFVWMPGSEALARVLAGSASRSGRRLRIHVFGQDLKILDPERFDGDRVEEMARLIHQRYCTLGNATTVEPWANLDEPMRQSNRERAASLEFKVRALGLSFAAQEQVPPANRVTSFSPEQICALDEMEHNRWVADRLLGGWSYAPERDNSRRRHPLIVPFALLPKSEKAKDATVAQEILDVLRLQGQCLFRRAEDRAG